ncbi:peptidase S8 [Mesobacillus zeae]|uniref:Peptidase S8 n=2 Tax=Mesobacillus zeae TaxID=1917180 RepID=A0A398BAN3_9BACI|nr:peptidase S8 [Mesobacillus zeae]
MLVFLAVWPEFNKSVEDRGNAHVFTRGEKTQQSGAKDAQPRMAKVNNIKMGEHIKSLLNNHEEVKLVHHNRLDKSHYYDHEVAVDFTQEPSQQELQQFCEQIGGSAVKSFNSTVIFNSPTRQTEDLLRFFSDKPNIEFAEPHYILMQNDVQLPNDVLYTEKYQWNLPAVGAEEGWAISRGSNKVTIAIVDTGVDIAHPDLKKRLVDGYNVLHTDQPPADDNGHGTHVAGIIASETNNREGIAGLTWYNKIMPVKAMGKDGYGSTFDIAKGIIWAVDHGADVINLSLGNYQPSKVLKKAVRYAYAHHVVMVAAAGNDNSSQTSFPAAYPEVMGVSAVHYNGNRADFSNHGDYIDIAAPGVYIPSTYYKQQYAALSGTSMAAPHVAALAGLILSANPELSNSDIMRIIQTSAIDLGVRGKDSDFGYGMIDIRQSLQNASKVKQPRDRIREKLDLFQRK